MPVTAAINANVIITESLTVLSSRYQNGTNGPALCPCPPAWQAGPQADRWPRWRAILTIMQKCSSQLYVKLQPRDVCHTTPRGFNPSKVHESEGRNARWCRFDPCSNYSKSWAILYIWERRIKIKDRAISFYHQHTFLVRQAVEGQDWFCYARH